MAASYAGKSRADVVTGLGMDKSRISHIFSGNGNVTLKTIHKVSRYLGYEFDVVFRLIEAPRALQPWQSPVECLPAHPGPINHVNVQLDYQTGPQVMADVLQKKDKNIYVSVACKPIESEFHGGVIPTTPVIQRGSLDNRLLFRGAFSVSTPILEINHD